MKTAPSLPAQPQPLIQLELELGAFCADWNHCDQLANFMARAVSYDRTDSFLYANLLSTVLNELLEIVFFRHSSEGQLVCAVLREGATDRIELTVPVDEGGLEFYRRGVALARSADVRELYNGCLLGAADSQSAVGLLELAADYGAEISLSEPAGGDLLLRVDLHLEEKLPAL